MCVLGMPVMGMASTAVAPSSMGMPIMTNGVPMMTNQPGMMGKTHHWADPVESSIVQGGVLFVDFMGYLSPRIYVSMNV